MNRARAREHANWRQVLLLLVRTSKDAPNQHDSDLMTFRRIPDFRSLALDLHAKV